MNSWKVKIVEFDEFCKIGVKIRTLSCLTEQHLVRLRDRKESVKLRKKYPNLRII